MKTTITLNQIFRNFSRQQRSCFSSVFLMLFLLTASSSWGQAAGDFRSRATGDWNNRNTWSRFDGSSWVSAGTGQTPLSTSNVEISNGHTVTVTANAFASSLTFTGAAATLTVNTSVTLTVTNGVTLNNAAGTSNAATISGAGTLSCSSLTIGGTETNLSSDKTTTLTSTISSMSISGNLNINGEDDGNDENDASFNLESGAVTVGGTINTDEENGSVVTLSLNTGAQSGTLFLSGNTPFTDIVGTPTINADGTTATVNYSGANQTVRALTYRNLTLSGSGTKTLAAATTVSAALTVKAGVTFANGGFALGTPTSVTLENGTTSSTISGSGLLTLGGNVTVNNISGTGTGALISCPVALGAARNFTVADETTSASDLTISGIVSTAFGLTKLGTGTITLSGNNTYTGTTTISQGIIKLGASSTTNASSPTGTTGVITVANGAALDMNGFSYTSGHTQAISINGTGVSGLGAITNSSGTASTLIAPITFVTAASIEGVGALLNITGAPVSGTTAITIGGAAGGSITSVIAGARALIKEDAGTWTLSGANTFTGLTTVSGGVLNIQNATATGTTAGGVTVASGAALQVQGGITVGAEALTLNGTGISNDGALRSVGTGNLTNTWGGTITLGSTARINADASSTLSIGNITGSNINLFLGGIGTINVTGAITTGTGSVTDDGPGNIIFSGTNTYSGATNINNGITNLGASNVFANNSNLVLNGGTFKTGTSSGFSDTMGTLTLSSNSTFAFGATSHTMAFTASNGVTWAGSILTIDNWTGTGGSSGTAGKITVGTTSSGLLPEQLAKFRFTGYAPGAVQLSNGEVVPTPAPVITSATTASSTYGTASSYSIVGSNTPTSYNATGLPTGISVNTATGVITVAATTAAGTYSISISATNASGTDTATLSYTVNTKALTVTGATTANKVYDGTNTATVTGGTLVGVVGSDVVTLTQSGTFAQTAIGTGIAITSTSTIGGANSGNYTLTQPSLTARNITAKALTVTGATTANKVYDGTNTATVTGGTLVGIVGSDVVTLTQSGTFAQTAVGTGIAITSTSTIGGANAGNYTLTQPSLTARNITAKALTVTGATTANKVYDGTNTATVTGGTLVGIVGSDVVTLTQSGTFAQTAIGTGIAITSTSTLGGANAGNYTLTQPSLTARNITAKALTVTGATTANKVYDGTNTATVTGGTLVGIVGSDVVTLTQSGTFAQTAIGTGIAITSTSTIGGANAGNYTLTQPSLTARDITAKALTVTGATTANKVYDGTNTATVTGGTLVGIVGSDVVTLTQSGTFAQTAIGTGIAITSTSTLGGANAGNYTLTQPSLTARDITAKALTVTGATTANKVYDGTNTATVTGGTLVGIVGSDVVTLTQSGTFAQTAVGTGIAITSTSTLGGANAGNYTLTQPSLTARNITAKALTVTGATTANKVYDGTNTATVTGGTLVGIVGSDVVTLTQSGTFAQTAIGTNIAITSTSTIGGANAGNYTLTQPSLTARDITAKELTVIGLTGSNKVYDGNTTATTSGTASLSGIVSSDVVTLSGTPTFTFASANVGTGIIISTTGYSISGANSNNYTLTQPTLSANITAKSLTITALDHSKCEGVNHVLPSNGYSITGLVGSETIGSVSLSSTGNPSNAVAGTYPIVAQNASGGTFNAMNYSISYVDGTLTVNPLSVGGTASVPSGTVCAGSSTTITLTNYTGNIQWQSSNNGNSWTNITDATNSTYTTPNLTQNIYYRADVKSGECSSVSSSSVSLTVQSAPSAVLSGTSSTCAGVSRNLIVTVTGEGSPYTLVYNDGSNNTTVSNYISGSNIAVSSLTDKTYTLVSVTTAAGCTSSISGSAVITITNATTTWNGTAWSNGEPTESKAAIISGTFTSPGTDPNWNLRACKLTVNSGATVLIKSGDSVTLDGALIASTGSFVTFNSGANLIQYGTTNENTGAIVIKRESARIKRLDYTMWSSPVAAQGLQAFSPNTLSNRFYSYNSSTNLYQAVDPSATNFSPFNGYLVRTANTHPTTPASWTGQFTGVPNNGNYSMAFTGYRLIGNPYPSAIDAENFIDTNIANGSITGTVYFWRKTNGSNNAAYCTYNLGGFVSNNDSAISNMTVHPNTSTNVVQVGQGFIVEGTGTSNVVFTNDMRIDSNVNRFLRTANTVERNRIWLNITNAAGSFSQAMIAYMTGATQGVDPSIDGKLLTDGDVSLASLIGTTSYAIQGRALPFDMTDVVPMSFKVTTAGDYTITIDHVDGLFSNGDQTIYLRDNTTGVVHNLSAGAYTFTSASGTFDTRFEITYQATSLAVSTPTFNESQVVIYKTPTNEISINTGKVVMSKVKIFDIRGRLLQEQKDINASQTLMNAGLTTEILLVQITSEEGIVVTKKVLFPRTSLKLDKKIEVKTQLAEDE